MTDFIDKLKENVKDILFPVRCPYCEIVIHKTEYACESCKKQFPSPAIIKYAVGGYKCTSPFPYDGIFKKAVKKFKFGNKGGYAKQLAFPMVQSILESYQGVNFDLITCVPMHKKRLIERGYNQAEILATELARLLNIPVASDVIKRIKNTLPQKNLDDKTRYLNLNNAFQIANSVVEYKSVILVDDIYTTGATMDSCSRTLKDNGVKWVYFISACVGRGF